MHDGDALELARSIRPIPDASPSPAALRGCNPAQQHEQYPNCWGVVYANHDPHKCMAEADAKRAAADRAQNAQLAKPTGRNSIDHRNGQLESTVYECGPLEPPL